jgi:broad specificity phosphatase PhoE
VYPSSVPQAVRDRWHTDISYRPDGGESLSELGERVRAACDDLAYDAIEETVVVVTHVSPVKAAVAWALDVEDTVAGRLWVDDAGVARIEVGPDGVIGQVRGFEAQDPTGTRLPRPKAVDDAAIVDARLNRSPV